jgi:TnpA family transposase
VPRRAVLSAADRSSLFTIPTDEGELVRHYTFDEQDLALIQQRRGGHNRLGFAAHLCYLRFPGYALPYDVTPPTVQLA